MPVAAPAPVPVPLQPPFDDDGAHHHREALGDSTAVRDDDCADGDGDGASRPRPSFRWRPLTVRTRLLKRLKLQSQ